MDQPIICSISDEVPTKDSFWHRDVIGDLHHANQPCQDGLLYLLISHQVLQQLRCFIGTE